MSSLFYLLGDYINDIHQPENVKEYILNAFCNICAEINENLKEAVIQHGRILKFFQETPSISDDIIKLAPWLLYNLYCQHITLLLDSDDIFTSCLKILDRTLSQLLPKLSIDNLSYVVRYLNNILSIKEPF